MINVLHIIQGISLGGAARAMIATAKYSSRPGKFHHIAISLLPADINALELAREAGITVLSAPDRNSIYQEIEKSDILHINFWNNPEIYEILRGDLPPVRLLLWYHISGDGSPQIITRKLIDFADMNIPSNPNTFNNLPLFRDMPSEEKAERVAMVYDATDFTRIKGIKLRKHDNFNVGYIGTVDFVKMHRNYVSMSAAVNIQNVKFIVCGGGIENFLKQHAQQLGASEKFDFRGYVKDIKSIIEIFDVYGYPLCEDTYASAELNLQEVMYAGVPPVVFPYGGVKDLVINGHTGLIVNSEKEYKEAIEYLYYNPGERKRLGENAKKYAKEIFGAENAAKSLNPIYEKMMGKPKKLRIWGMKSHESLLWQPVTLGDLTGNIKKPSGAELFIETLGDKGGDFIISMTSNDIHALFEAEKNIGKSSFLLSSHGSGGIINYRNYYQDDPYLRLWSGLVLQNNDNSSQAIPEFIEAMKHIPDNWRIAWYLAQASEKAGNISLAKDLLNNILKVVPSFSEAQKMLQTIEGESFILKDEYDLQESLLLVNELREAGLVEEAFLQLEEFILKYPDSPDLLNLEAELKFQTGKVEESKNLFLNLSDRFPENSRILNNTGAIFWNEKNAEKAMEYLIKALKADPDNRPAVLNLADILVSLKKYEDARKIFSSYLERNPEDKEIELFLESIKSDGYEDELAEKISIVNELRQKGILEEAYNILLETIQLHTDSPYLLNLQAELKYQMGKIEEAKNDFLYLSDCFPSHGQILNNLGVIHLGEGDFQKALSYYRKSLEINPSDRVATLNLADLLITLKDYSSSEKLLTYYLENNPGDEVILSALESLKASFFSQLIEKKSSETKKVSAIVSTYNSEKFIQYCLEDLVNQTLYKKGDLEIIIVDTASQENEGTVVEKFKKEFSSENIIYINTGERESLYAAWNKGIKIASGKYITNANTDDRHRFDALEIMADYLDNNPLISLVYGDCYVSFKPNETYEENDKVRLYRYPMYFPPSVLLHYQFGPQPMWRKEIHETIGYFNEAFRAAGDYDFNIRFALSGLKAYHISEPLGLFLENVTSISKKDDIPIREVNNLRNVYQNFNNIEMLYKICGVSPETSEDRASVYNDMGVRAFQYYPSWNEGRPESQVFVALKCFLKSVELNPLNYSAINNLAVAYFLSGNKEHALSLLKKISDRSSMKIIENNMKNLDGNPPYDLHLIPSELSLPDQLKIYGDRKEVLSPSILQEDKRQIDKDSRKLKIAFYVHNFPEYRMAGTELYTYNLAMNLQQSGHTVRIIYPSYDLLLPEYNIEEGFYKELPVTRINLHIQADPVENFKNDKVAIVFGEYLLGLQPDLIHFQHLLGISASAINFCAEHNIPVVMTIHDGWFICNQYHFIKDDGNFCEKGPETVNKCVYCYINRCGINPSDKAHHLTELLSYRRAFLQKNLQLINSLIFPSNFLKRNFEKHGFKHPNSVISPLGLSLFTPMTYSGVKGLIRFSYIGNIIHTKGLDILINAFNLIETDSAELNIYGNIQSNIYFHNIMSNVLKGKKVKYFGPYEPHDLPVILSKTDIAVIPSRSESYSFVIRECLHARVPVIASDVAAIPEIIRDGENGFLFKAGDYQDLGKKLDLFIKNPELMSDLRKNIQPVSSISEDTQRVEHIYYETLKKIASTAYGQGNDKIYSFTINIGVILFDPPEVACPTIRILSPFSYLKKKGFNIIQLLEKNGNEKSINIKRLLDTDILIIQRQVPAILPYHMLEKHFTQKKPKIVFEIDDALTLLPEKHPEKPYFNSIKPLIEEYLTKADLITVTTEGMKKLYKNYNKNAFILQNFIDRSIWCAPYRISTDSNLPVRILFSGTITHTPDFHIIEHVLSDIIREHDNVEILLWGGTDKSVFMNSSKVKNISEFCPDYMDYARILQSVEADFAVIPLENNLFNSGKSHVKWLEYSICSIPGIYSNEGEYIESIENRVTGLLVENTYDAWYDAIKEMIESKDLRKSISKNAYETVLKKYILEDNIYRWEEVYRKLLLSQKSESAKSVTEVSIVIPVYNKLDFTIQCIDKIRENTGSGDYEIVVVDNGSTDRTRETLDKYNCVKVIHNIENFGFAKACNQGVKEAEGRYILFLNNDTEVKPGWLDPLIKILDENKHVAAAGSKLLYPDGTIQHAGVEIVDHRTYNDPLLARHIYCKENSDYGPANELKTYQALTAACLLVRKSHFEQVGGFDEGFMNGYEDVDLCFKLQEKGYLLVYEPKSVVIHHESKSGPERFRHVRENIERLHQKWLGKISPDVIESEGKTIDRNAGRIRPYIEPSGYNKDLVSIIILTFNQLHHTKICLDSIEKHTPLSHEIIIVDNGSTDGTVEYLKEYIKTCEHARVIANSTNLGFSAGNNQGMAIARGEYILLLNNDTIVTEGWLSSMISLLEREPKAGIAGPVTNNISGPQKIKEASYETLEEMEKFASQWTETHKGQTILYPRVVGFCLLTRKSVIDLIGCLDERFATGNFEDDDFCIRAAQAGYEARIVMDSFVHHTGSQTFKGAKINYMERMMKNWKLFKEKWGIPEDAPVEKGYSLSVNSVDVAKYYIALPDISTDHRLDKNNKWWHDLTSKNSQIKLDLLQEGEKYLQEGLLKEAEKNFREFLKLYPDYGKAYNKLASVLYKKGDIKEASREITKALKLSPDDCDTVKNYGHIMTERSQKSGAFKAYKDYLSKNPHDEEIKDLLDKLVEEDNLKKSSPIEKKKKKKKGK
jgi:GT2 family glycosyltransferase/glycosyltransferase involved in cell wall biosynthesis/Flp pilus assembly protein TadD